jgi:hypothetical protein
MGVAMDPRPEITTEVAPEPTVRAAEDGLPPSGASPGTILLLATWVGLVAGWLDLGLMVVNRRLIHGDFYRLSDHFVWLIPLGVAVMVLVPGMVLALIARLRRRGIRPGIDVGLLAFVGFLDVCARLPLELWGSILLSGGLAVQSARMVGTRRQGTLRLMRRTTPLLIGALLAVMLAKLGGRAWSEHRAIAA